ncbi:ferritin-like domain-containing protein [Mucilaginibacter sp. dw_454]|uniref:ferritin-like domain-containing protein n=1 Tax=Mucilaginibacter sp. dw_454 TaxID=2720079 RepID=UPI001BD35AC2|nr:ferritin-like domain-containing protein [Mucilaginibacter sp. dw_454]
MNLLGIIEEIEKADPEFQDRISPRRAAIKNITSFGSKVAVAAMPFAFSTLLKKAYGQTATPSVNDVLNYALKLEFLESAFYNAGVASNISFSASEKAYLVTIQGHENAHVSFLQSVLGSAAVAQSTQGTNGTYDFTAGGTFGNVLTNADTYFAVAQAFEDTGVRAYKGQAGFLLGNKVVLTAALDIHSVEARHASAIRQVRRARGSATTKPWIVGANDTGIAAVNGNYAGEDNVVQGGVTITNLAGVSGNVSLNAATACFDEPLTSAQVVALVAPFGVK